MINAGIHRELDLLSGWLGAVHEAGHGLDAAIWINDVVDVAVEGPNGNLALRSSLQEESLMDQPMTVTVRLGPTDAPARRGPDPTEEWRRQLAQLGEARIGASGAPHTRSIGVATLAEIVVTLTGVAGGLGDVVETVHRAQIRRERWQHQGAAIVEGQERVGFGQASPA